MEQNQVSMTALLTAYARAYHATHDNPKIFDDFIANALFTEQERTYLGQSLAQSLAFFDPELAASCTDQATALAWYMRLQGGPTPLSRGRYTEDRLEETLQQGIQQYVILGAGMDTFAFRRPDLVKHLQVFEIDHPSTQTAKRERLAKLGREFPPQLHFAPVDFMKENLADALEHSAYDPRKLSFFSWLGVTYYLTRDAVFATLRTIAEIAPAGSSIVFDYLDADAFDRQKADRQAQRMQEIVKNVGEPMKTGFDPSMLAMELDAVGLRLHENLSPSEIEKRYFAGRTDGYHAAKHMHFAWAIVA